MAISNNIFVDQGSDYSSIVTVLSASGAPLNLTGYTAKSQMRKSYGSSVFHNFVCEVSNAVEGKLRLSLSAADTELITPGRWLYDVEITQTSSGKKKRIVEGIVTVTPQITKI